MIDKWIALQLAPLATLNPPSFLKYLDDLLLHTFPFPFFLVKSDYKKLYEAFYEHSAPILDKAESFGIKRDEACHNLVFLACFNSYAGMKTFFPTLIKIEPPVPFQYGEAKKDMVVHSHDASYEIKKGEMIFGFQPFATNDPRVFDNPREFVAIDQETSDLIASDVKDLSQAAEKLANHAIKLVFVENLDDCWITLTCNKKVSNIMEIFMGDTDDSLSCCQGKALDVLVFCSTKMKPPAFTKFEAIE
ncbi:hypothetical protein GH714_011283 [Hevea brasiliensis]|uniref:Uncharacterized protein n=1 Tax=Hevea brasiliensis TaxID=3981 RepID=A0A6A6KZC0_HEVBR|nr:hypothetical protein GH714_011283 [Hevea brasiliensis]